jgi:hypothetical protein
MACGSCRSENGTRVFCSAAATIAMQPLVVLTVQFLIEGCDATDVSFLRGGRLQNGPNEGTDRMRRPFFFLK